MKNQNYNCSMNILSVRHNPRPLARLLAKFSLAAGVLVLASAASVRASTLTFPSRSLSSYCATAPYAGGSYTVYYTDPFKNTPSVQCASTFITILSVKPTWNSYSASGPWTWAVSYTVATNSACPRYGTITIDGLTFSVEQAGSLLVGGMHPSNWAQVSGMTAVTFSWVPECPLGTNAVFHVEIATETYYVTTIEFDTRYTSASVILSPGNYSWYVVPEDQVSCSPANTLYYVGVGSTRQYFTVVNR